MPRVTATSEGPSPPSPLEASGTGRTIGLLGATGIGVGAIVGGGVLALAGVAFAATGPGALVAFAANGLIAILTALSFAEMAAAFPESGGTYTYAKKVLSPDAAFMVGWVVWLASIVAAVLYALGFAAYGQFAAADLWRALAGSAPGWLESRAVLLALAFGATGFYGVALYRKATGGGQWATIGKVVVFAVLIVGGLWALAVQRPESWTPALSPFFPGGALGLVQAMGYTFIALQGFDLIAAVGGEVRDPQRTIPRAMLLSLGTALAIYLPLLFVIATVGVGAGGSIAAMSAADPATVVAIAARNFLGPFGFWMVIVAALLSMVSALQANLLAASRVALTMSRDRTLFDAIGAIHQRWRTPGRAVVTTVGVVAAILLVVGDVAVAGAVSSLIFLISFALTHGTNILTQIRGGVAEVPFRVPWFPLVPVVGGLACLALALFQGLAVPAAGAIAGVWLILGFTLYLFGFRHRADVWDASTESRDPDLVRLRGRSPLVLVPIAKPASAPGMTEVANALAPPNAGRVLLLSIIQPPGMWDRGDLAQQLVDMEAVVARAITISVASGSAPECLTTVAPSPWPEIARVARSHRCESLLIGLGALDEEATIANLERLINEVQSDVVVLRAPETWRLSEVRRVVVPVGGRRDQSTLRARLLGSLWRSAGPEIKYLRILPERTSDAAVERARREIVELASDEVPEPVEVELVRSARIEDELVERASDCELLVLGLRRLGKRRRALGETTLRLARRTSCPMILISRR